MKNSFFRPSFIFALLLCILFVAADVFLFSEIRDADSSSQELSAERDSARMQSSRIVLMKDSLDKTAASRAKLDSYLVDKDKVVDFLEEIEATGKALGIPVKVDSVTEDSFLVGSTTVPVFRVSAGGTGTWKQAVLLSEEIRSLPHKIIFTSLSLQSANDIPLDKKGQPVSGTLPHWNVMMEFVAVKNK